ncbi:ABC transporter permease [Gynuella sp.]|uniref:ABC transporter permease n=1 Tax=Gynuella sp. TaxID=2969146 RepID=UPI003D0B8C3D
MSRMILNRLFQAIMMAWSVGTLTFVLARSLPGDMAYKIAAGRYGEDAVSSAAAAAVRAELGLDRPAWEQYLSWLSDLITLNLGNSLISGAPVIEEIQHQLGHSLLLAVCALLLSALIALPIGILSGLRPNGWLDYSTLTLSTLIRAQPVFSVGLILVLFFAIQLRWFPVAGFGHPVHLVLPSLALALSLAAISNRVIRGSVRNVAASAYYQFARVKGLGRGTTFLRHGLRNMAVPVVAFMGIQLVGLIEGVIMIESLFAWPGIGHGLSHAVFSRDIPMLQGTALVMGILFVLLNTLVDASCHLLDPRGQRS